MKYHAGDTVAVRFDIARQDGTPEDIPQASLVELALRNEPTLTGPAILVAGPWACVWNATSSLGDASWSGGVVIGQIDGNDTGSVSPGQYWLELQITTNQLRRTVIGKKPLTLYSDAIP